MNRTNSKLTMFRLFRLWLKIVCMAIKGIHNSSFQQSTQQTTCTKLYSGALNFFLNGCQRPSENSSKHFEICHTVKHDSLLRKYRKF